MTQDPHALAKQLQANGIAHSDSQALEMAKGMIGTGEKVTDNFNQRRDEIIEGYKRPSSKIDMDNPYVRDNVQRMRKAAMESAPVDVQIDYEIPIEDAVEETTEVESFEPVEVQAESVEEVALATIQLEGDSEEPGDPDDSGSEEEAEPVEALAEESPREAKDTSAEESVDLNQMFNFGS